MSFDQRIHEAFNARSLATEDLCRSFIVTPEYFRLAMPGNSILVGPRGSGKTTLMRMLQVEALNIWERAPELIDDSSLRYSGVFIPTDKLWATQYELLKKKASTNDLKSKVELVFGYHVFERFLQVVEFRARREGTKNNFLKVNIDKNVEEELVVELAESWDVYPRFNSLRSLCFGVKEKWREMVDAVSSWDSSTESNGEAKVDGSTIINRIASSASLVNSYFGQHDHVWTLLFDELELAPPEIVQNLIDMMRGGHINLNFKLSMSPYHQGVGTKSGATGQMKKHDLEYIDLTEIKDAKASLRFSQELALRVLKITKDDLDFSGIFEKPKRPDFKKSFESLSNKDVSFSRYLEKSNISFEEWDNYKEAKKTEIRRFQYIAYLRDQYFNSNMRRRSLKRPLDYYAGDSSVFKALEYNPRMIISFFNNLSEKLGEKHQFSISEQLDSLKDMRVSFEALINTISLDLDAFGSLASLINKIGLEFSEGILGDDFKSEPFGSFFVKEDSPIELVQAVGLAVNAGAVIKVVDNSDNSRSSDEIVGQRYRLSYIFAHKYKLPLQVMRVISLTDILVATPFKRGSKVQISLL